MQLANFSYLPFLDYLIEPSFITNILLLCPFSRCMVPAAEVCSVADLWIDVAGKPAGGKQGCLPLFLKLLRGFSFQNIYQIISPQHYLIILFLLDLLKRQAIAKLPASYPFFCPWSIFTTVFVLFHFSFCGILNSRENFTIKCFYGLKAIT